MAKGIIGRLAVDTVGLGFPVQEQEKPYTFQVSADRKAIVQAKLSAIVGKWLPLTAVGQGRIGGLVAEHGHKARVVLGFLEGVRRIALRRCGNFFRNVVTAAGGDRQKSRPQQHGQNRFHSHTGPPLRLLLQPRAQKSKTGQAAKKISEMLKERR